MKQFILLMMLMFSTTAFPQSKVAVVKLLRGEVEVLTLGKTSPLKKDDWVEQGAVIKTAEKSFVKLIFLDKSQMNVGPNSEMKIEKFSGKDSGVIDLVKGKIRSQVTKDYLQIKEKDKSKLFIKTQNAVMGVRGTDFMIATNGATTSTILFEGEVVFNKLENRAETSSNRLEEIVDRGVRMYPGEFSVMDPSRSMPTVPALLNVQQIEKLETNKEFDASNASNTTGSANKEPAKSVVPEGLSGNVVANKSDVLKTEVAQVAPANQDGKKDARASADPNGYVNGDKIKPANGSFVHVESGVIIGPGKDSVLDANTNTFIPGKEIGTVDAGGGYVPPPGRELTNDGKWRLLPNNETPPEDRTPSSGEPKPDDGTPPTDEPLDPALPTDPVNPGEPSDPLCPTCVVLTPLPPPEMPPLSDPYPRLPPPPNGVPDINNPENTTKLPTRVDTTITVKPPQ